MVPEAGHRHARLRPHRRRPQRRLRRLQRRGRRRPQQRRQGANCVITADGGWRRGKVVPLKQNVDQALDEIADRREVHRLQPLQSAGRHEGRPRSLVARPDGRRLRRLPAGAARQRTPALHPLHLRFDRQTQGRAAHHGRLPARRVARRTNGCSTCAKKTSTGVRPTSAG